MTADTPKTMDTTITISISKYLFVSFFCLSLITITTITILRLFHIKIKQSQSLRSPIYTGSTTCLSLDSFDSEGYLRPHTDELPYIRMFFNFFSAVCAVFTTTFLFVLIMINISWLKKKRHHNLLYPKDHNQYQLEKRDYQL